MSKVKVENLDKPLTSVEAKLYTDGSCLGNPGPGGWSAVLVDLNQTDNIEEIKKIKSGGHPDSTNNEMELRAIEEGLEMIHSPTVVITDSRYCYKGCTDWIWSWQSRGWKTSSGSKVKHIRMWKRVLSQLKEKAVSFRLVKGHSGVEYNELADNIASQEATQVQKKLRGLEKCKKCRYYISYEYKLGHCQKYNVFDVEMLPCKDYEKGDDIK